MFYFVTFYLKTKSDKRFISSGLSSEQMICDWSPKLNHYTHDMLTTKPIQLTTERS